ncbi:uncharacterized protein F5891DRAFT_1223707 [Suillus fuscotomentosus]|uniref:Uncharacterized protein n=1 Tax=Suillus fuscotomentosus TaxID=1912939 RepID=A0AAD4E883_9AGAM|nr:uncharacterized protein F5891DRAFT_1223707 [Suillus fuscotomentosus]KAG1901126.1 hypothetical protein F5891DRAFT_1223707 [Suillus fuscotomentosus]
MPEVTAHACLFPFRKVDACHRIPAPHNQNKMNQVLDEELDGNVMWEEKVLPRNVESVMDAIFAQSDFTPESIGTIMYQPIKSSSGRKSTGVPVFIPAARGAGGTWQLDRKNIQPRSLVRTSASRKKMPHKKTKLRSQTSTAVSALTDTEVEGLDSSLTAPDTNKSFNAQEYNDKNPNNKRVKTSATAEGRWTLLFNTIQAAMHSLYAKLIWASPPWAHIIWVCLCLCVGPTGIVYPVTMGGPMGHILRDIGVGPQGFG